MNDRTSDDENGLGAIRVDNAERRSDYEVGYGKPPEKHRFVKGQSGNPLGRPKGAKNKSKDLAASLNPLEELYQKSFQRLVTVVTNGVSEQKPAIQCVIDRTIADGARGDNRSKKLALDAFKAWSDTVQLRKSQAIGHNSAYKYHWAPIFEAARKRGSPEPHQLPHPAHLYFIPETFEASVGGPQNAYEKADWDELKGHLRWLNDFIEDAPWRVRFSPDDGSEKNEIAELRRCLKRTERMVPDGWDWRECVTDVDREYYRQRESTIRNRQPGSC